MREREKEDKGEIAKRFLKMMGLAYMIITLSGVVLYFSDRAVLPCSILLFPPLSPFCPAVSSRDGLLEEGMHYRRAVAIMIMAVMAYF